jgi:protein O-GlcNAc transferase
VPHGRLLVHAPNGTHRQRVLDALRRAGPTAPRVQFVGTQSFGAYLGSYREIDIGLDPVPFNGGTTTCDALWMGVPVVTRTGETAVSRGGSSILSNLGLTDLIARNDEDYVRIAAGLAADGLRLAELRSTLRQRLRASRLMDAASFARDMESAFRFAWRAWCERTPP